ncbi:hypothetical protein P9738_18315 [Bacillus siamensis]|uniref:hypothetical protein n=1 Tax=Bacillus siamensis TaxID=659243 RepID=UPI002E2398A7|nr:hypothetical protein [Bacillus siamensis]MED5098091.1 hypothetical protein [Bacillus siamensis]
MISIKKDLIPKSNGNRPGYAMDPDYITAHHTSNNGRGHRRERCAQKAHERS